MNYISYYTLVGKNKMNYFIVSYKTSVVRGLSISCLNLAESSLGIPESSHANIIIMTLEISLGIFETIVQKNLLL